MRFGPYHESGRVRWVCKCICGNEKLLIGKDLVNGHTKSCGCLKSEVDETQRITHGQTGTRTYRIWKGMKQRCYNPKQPHFVNYGGRGIYICDRWLNSFENFLADMGECPENYSIERTNNDGPYAPENCKWRDRIAQNNNKRNSPKNQKSDLDLFSN